MKLPDVLHRILARCFGRLFLGLGLRDVAVSDGCGGAHTFVQFFFVC